MDPSYISPSIDGQQLEQARIPHELSRANQCFGSSDLGEGVRVNANIVRMVMHIGIYGRSLSLPRPIMRLKVNQMNRTESPIILYHGMLEYRGT